MFSVWSPTLQTGIAPMDEDHKKLARLIEELYAVCVDHCGDYLNCRSCRDLLVEAIELHQQHFEAEEAEMRAVGYPRVHKHTAEHHRLLTRLVGFWKMCIGMGVRRRSAWSSR